eukprot:7396320-Prorocentrum_lima.AAC.1
MAYLEPLQATAAVLTNPASRQLMGMDTSFGHHPGAPTSDHRTSRMARPGNPATSQWASSGTGAAPCLGTALPGLGCWPSVEAVRRQTSS